MQTTVILHMYTHITHKYTHKFTSTTLKHIYNYITDTHTNTQTHRHWHTIFTTQKPAGKKIIKYFHWIILSQLVINILLVCLHSLYQNKLTFTTVNFANLEGEDDVVWVMTELTHKPFTLAYRTRLHMGHTFSHQWPQISKFPTWPHLLWEIITYFTCKNTKRVG